MPSNFKILFFFNQKAKESILPSKSLSIRLLYFAFYISIFTFLTSCSISKHLPAGESLYAGAKVNIIADSSITKPQATAIKTELETIVRPLPNTQILGFPYKVWFYYLLGEPKKNSGLRYWFRNRFGEAPILANKRITTNNAELISNYLDNSGFFGSTSVGSFVEKDREATAIYTTHLTPRYYIDKVSFYNKDTSVFGKNLVATQANSLLKPKNPYNFQDIKSERERIAGELRKQGFYMFYPDYLIILADTTVGNHRVNLTVEAKPTTSQIAKKVYFIRDIYVQFNDSKSDSAKVTDKKVAQNFHLLNLNRTYKKRIFLDAISFRSGSLFNSNLQDVSLTRLVNLGNFKFVKSRFDLVPRSDSALLNLNYYLTPLKKKSLSAEIGGSNKSNGLTGTNLSLIWRNRNAFRGAELFSLSANISYEWQIGGGSLNEYNNNIRWFFESKLEVPRFLIPFIHINPVKNQILPKTNFALRYEKLIKKELYDQTSISASMGYAWKPNAAIEHSYTPFSVNVISTNATPAFVDQIFRSNDPLSLLKILDERLILGAAYSFNYIPNNGANQRRTITFKGGVDIAGNLAGLIAPQTTNGDARQLFGILYEQYARFDADFRYFQSISKSVRWANRFMVGVGIPYGNSTTLPPFKQFFAGGTNSLRAFQTRTVGPGTYYPTDTTLSKYLISNTGGDIKIEMNTELRAKITNFIHTAAFIDAGNVWMYKDASLYDGKGIFNKDFLNELAVGGGLGLRFDFTYLIFRLDAAIPFRKPWLDDGKRWVFNQIDFTNSTWRRDNIVLNLAVGYPF